MEPKSPARIIIADAQPIVRFGFRELARIEPMFSICGEAARSTDALRLITHSTVDLVITDIALEDDRVLGLIRQLREAAPLLPMLVFSAHDENVYAERVLTLGARGFVSKSEPIDVLTRAMKRVLSGAIYLSDRISQRLLERMGSHQMSTRDKMAQLTHRELEVLEMIGRGFSTAAIAGTLALSTKTVETHRSRIRSKLGLKDATELIRYAVVWVQYPFQTSSKSE